MASFIVEGIGPNGVRTWVVIEGSNTDDARTKSNQILEQGFFPNIVATANADGVAKLNIESPGFSARFPSNNYTVERIVSDLGGAVQPDLSPPPPLPPTVNPGGQSSDQSPSGPILGSEDFGLLPAFEAGLRDRGMGYGVGSGVQGQLAGQEFGNLQSRGLLETAFNAPAGQLEGKFEDPNQPTAEELRQFQGPTFQNYVKNAALFGGGATADANRLFSQALELSKGRSPGFGAVDDAGVAFNNFTNPISYAGSQALPTEIAGAFLNPTQGGAGSEDLARAARQAGRSRFGFASKFLPSAERLTNSFFAQPQQGAQTFADFLNNRIFGV